MSTASLVAHQARYDLRTFLRDPRARGFTLALPLLLLLLFGYIFRHQSFSYSGGVSIPGDSYYVPRMIVLGLAGATLSNLVVVLVAKRETGALKRRRAGSPGPPPSSDRRARTSESYGPRAVQRSRTQRRRTGIEPASAAVQRSPVLKTGGATRHPDASASTLLGLYCGRGRWGPRRPKRLRRTA
jgi:hypothetical protein